MMYSRLDGNGAKMAQAQDGWKDAKFEAGFQVFYVL
jgi:hypothetical protein